MFGSSDPSLFLKNTAITEPGVEKKDGGKEEERPILSESTPKSGQILKEKQTDGSRSKPCECCTDIWFFLVFFVFMDNFSSTSVDCYILEVISVVRKYLLSHSQGSSYFHILALWNYFHILALWKYLLSHSSSVSPLPLF